MDKITKIEAIERIEELIQEVDGFEDKLKGLDVSVLNLGPWQKDVEKALKLIFPDKADHIEKFKKIKFEPVPTAGGYIPILEITRRREAYQTDLKRARLFLKSRIEEIKEYWKNENVSDSVGSKALAKPSETRIVGNKIFIVHGHDERLKNQLEIFLTEIKLESVVLHRKADEGLTIIEKIEKHSDVGYAFILLTPDDIGYPISEDSKPDQQRAKEKRARQNVIFEFGYFVGKLGRNRVCCLYKKGVALPADIVGMIYKQVSENVEEVAFSIQKDLKTAGYSVNI